jgi:hypothetical protein
VVQDATAVVDNDAVTVRIAVDHFSGCPIVISISARSMLILSVVDDTSGHSDGTEHDILRFISLPLEVDPVRATCALDSGHLTLKLPLSPSNGESGSYQVLN